MLQIVVCEYCGRKFEAKRKTAKYCSSNCRVNNHREPGRKRAQMDMHAANLLEAIEFFGEMKYDHEHSYEAVLNLLSAKTSILYRVPAVSWWHCRKCKTNVHVELPDSHNCGCEKPDWQLLDTEPLRAARNDRGD